LEKVRLCMRNIPAEDFKDHELLFNWLFNQFRSWKAIKPVIDN